MSTVAIAVIISMLSAAVALLALIWNIISWKLNRRIKLRLDIGIGHTLDKKGWIIYCRCINDSNHKVYIKNARLEIPYRRYFRRPAFIWMDPWNKEVDDELNGDIFKSEPLEPHKDQVYYVPGEPIAISRGSLHNIGITVETVSGQKFRAREKRLTEIALAYSVLLEQSLAKKGEYLSLAEIAERTEKKRMEWVMRSLEKMGWVEIKQDNEGKIVALRLTETGIRISNNVRLIKRYYA